MQYTVTITLPDGQKLELKTSANYAALTETEMRMLSAMKKDIGLENIKTEVPHHAWSMKLNESTIKTILKLLLAKGIKDIPFVLADGTIRFANILILIDDAKDESIPLLITKLLGIAIAYNLILNANDKQLKTYMFDITTTIAGQKREDKIYPGALLESGAWETGWLYVQSITILNEAEVFHKISIKQT